MLRRRNIPLSLPQIRLQHPAKQLQQHLEANLGNSWIIASFAKLVSNKGMLRPGEFVKTENTARFTEFIADQVTTLVGDVGVFYAKD